MAESTHGTRLSVFAWAVYLGLTGTALLLVPDTLTDLLGMDGSKDAWVRVAGVVVLVAAAYYLGAAIHRARWMYWYSVPVRILSGLALAGLAVTQDVWQLFVFGAIDVLGAGWTFAGLRWKPLPEPLEPSAGS